MKRSLTLIAIFTGLCATSALAQTAVKQDPKQEPKQDPWKQAGADNSLREAFEKALYSLKDSGHGTFSGANDAQRLSMEFDAHEARLKHPDGSVGFHLAGYGYGDMLKKPESPKLSGDGTRLEYRRGDITEWYVNGKQGLEQGFTLAKKPSGANTGQPLTIALRVTGSLGLSQQGGAVLLKSGKSTVLRYEGLSARDALGRTIPAHMEARNNQIRILVEDQHAQYPLTVDPNWTQQGELTASDGNANDSFGTSVAVDGNLAVIGAPNHLVGNNHGQGVAYLFEPSGSGWAEFEELTASDGAAGDLFGYSVAVSGTTVVIGAPGSGGAYVFQQEFSFLPVWVQQQEFNVSGEAFGQSVSVRGSTAVIGAPNLEVGTNTDQGAAYVYVFTGSGFNGSWSLQQELTASDGAANDNFGISVAVDGTNAVVGAYLHQVGSAVSEGAAYVFAQSGTTWTKQAELTASDGADNEGFGTSVALSGTTAVIGGPTYGKAYIFVQSGSTWTLQQELTTSDSTYNYFGDSVALNGTTAVIGAYGQSGFDGNPHGAAYVYAQSGTTWTLQDELTSPDGGDGDQYGIAVAVSGTNALIGANAHQVGSNGGQGAVYAFAQQAGSNSGALTIVQSLDSPNFQLGPASFLLYVINSSGYPTAGVATISDTLDPAFTITGVSPACTVSSQTVTCTVPAGSPGTSTSIFAIDTTISGTAGPSIVNTATLTDISDTVLIGSSSVTVSIGAQLPVVDVAFDQVSISGSTDNPPCVPGGTLTATVVLNNEVSDTLYFTTLYPLNISLSGGNLLLQESNGFPLFAGPDQTGPFNFSILLATCNTFYLSFDVAGTEDLSTIP